MRENRTYGSVGGGWRRSAAPGRRVEPLVGNARNRQPGLRRQSASPRQPPTRPIGPIRTLPDGYGLSLLGCILFAIAGVLDMTWHLTFGIERGFQALISPTHLTLMVSGGLIVSGPLRGAWRRPGRSIGWPAIASATLTLTVLTFFGQFDHPFTSQWSALPHPALPSEPAEELGIVGLILQAGLLMGVVLLLLRRFDLPAGSLTFLMTVNAAFVIMIKGADPVILVGVAGGVVADLLLVALRPSSI